jgi:hypothetical protein
MRPIAARLSGSNLAAHGDLVGARLALSEHAEAVHPEGFDADGLALTSQGHESAGRRSHGRGEACLHDPEASADHGLTSPKNKRTMAIEQADWGSRRAARS